MNDCTPEGGASVLKRLENESSRQETQGCPVEGTASSAGNVQPGEAAPRAVLGMALLMGLGLAIMLHGLFSALAAILRA